MENNENFENKKYNFSININVNDKSKIFIEYWNQFIINNLKNNLCSIGKDNNTIIKKSLYSFNINLNQIKENEKILSECLFTIDIILINSEKELKDESLIKKLKESLNFKNFNLIFYKVKDLHENSLKNMIKNFEKFKEKINNKNISILPYKKDIKYSDTNSIEEFLNNFKIKLCDEFNLKLLFLSEQIKNYKLNKDLNENEDVIFEYLKYLETYLNYLIFCELWEDCKNLIKDDLFKYINVLSKNNSFEIPFDFTNFNEMEIHKKINEKKLNNIEYQQYLIYIYLNSIKHLKNFYEIIEFVSKIFFEKKLFNKSFKTNYHYYFWNILFISKFLDYIDFIKNDLDINDKNNLNILENIQIKILIYKKKLYKNYADLIKYNIPDDKNFNILLNFNFDKEKIIEYNTNILQNFNEKYDENFKLFKEENILNDKYEQFLNIELFYKDYFKLLNNLNILINKQNLLSLSLKINLECIYILFVLNDFNEIKNILIRLLNIKQLKNNNWNIIYEYLIYLLLIIFNLLEYNSNNLKILLDFINIKYQNINKFDKIIFNKDNSNIFFNLFCRYINFSNNEEEFSFSLNNILNFELLKENNKNNNIIYINNQNANLTEIKIKYSNYSDFSINLDKITLLLNELYCNEENNNDIEYILDKKDLNINKINPFEIDKELIIKLNINNKEKITLKNNSYYKLKSFKFYFKNNIIGFFDNFKKIIIFNIKQLDLEINSNIINLCNENDNKNLYYNILNILNIKLKNISSNDFFKDKLFKIEIIDLNNNSDFIILKNDISLKIDNILIKNNLIEFPINSLLDSKIIENLKIPFYIENFDYDTNSNKKLKIIISLFQNNNLIYEYKNIHEFNSMHLFSMKNKYKLIKNEKLLMQSTFILNIELKKIIVFLDNNKIINIEKNQTINVVNILSKNLEENEKYINNKFLLFSINNDNNNENNKNLNKIKYYYPKNKILEEIKQILNLPYYITINIDNKINYYIYEEFYLNIKIKKYSNKTSIINISIKENENWSIIGKSRILEQLDNNKNECEMEFKLMPLIDGFLHLPEIEFLESEIKENENNNKKDNNLNSIDFNQIEFGTYIEGNEKILKINSLSENTVKLNLL